MKRSDLKGFFITESTERGRFATELQSVLTKLGKTGKKASARSREHCNGYRSSTKVILGAGDKTVLKFVEKGEDEVNEAYREAVCVLSPSDVAEIVRRQARSLQTAQDRVKDLRDRLAAA